MFDVKIVADSIAPCGKRLTTIIATYPRIIHSEVLTHRDRARNAASSRAIPWRKMKDMVITEPFIPIAWGLEQKGMQTGDQIHPDLAMFAEKLWLEGRTAAAEKADQLHNIGDTYYQQTGNPAFQGIKIHKSIPNRMIEPYAWIAVVMTATEWKNFYRLRCHSDAEVHFQKIAGMIRLAITNNTPRELQEGAWHLPFITPDELANDQIPIDIICKMSVARCSRVSYMNQDKTPLISDDLAQFERLVTGSGFGHWSAHEHIARATNNAKLRSGPFVGFEQYRKQFLLENEPG